jgi:hypothetical protein
MKKTKVVEAEIVEPDIVCGECNEILFQCDELMCEKEFEEGQTVYCAKRVRRHYCSKCGKRSQK